MAEWTGRGVSAGHDLQLGLLRISTTDQTYRGCGWCWHVTAEHSYGNDALTQSGDCASEDEAKAAGVAWVQHHCEATLAALPLTAPQQVDTGVAERDHLAKLVEGMINQAPQSIYGKPNVRMALAIAASVVRRGRHLTAREELMNLAAGMEEPIDGDTPEEAASAKDLANRIRAAAGPAS